MLVYSLRCCLQEAPSAASRAAPLGHKSRTLDIGQRMSPGRLGALVRGRQTEAVSEANKPFYCCRKSQPGADALKICGFFAGPVGVRGGGGGGGRYGRHKMASTALHQFLNGTPDDCSKSILAPGQIHLLVLLGYHVDSHTLVCRWR